MKNNQIGLKSVIDFLEPKEIKGWEGFWGHSQSYLLHHRNALWRFASNSKTDTQTLSVTSERVAVANEFVAGAQLALLHQWQFPETKPKAFQLARIAGNLFVGLEDLCLRTDDCAELGIQYDKDHISEQTTAYPEFWTHTVNNIRGWPR